MSEEQMRAEFEAFASKHGLCVTEDGDLYRSHVVAWMWKAWQAALSAKSVPESDEATTELRVVYEAARKFLRYNGADKDKVNQALDELDKAIEAVKHIDGGYKDFPLEAAPPIPTDDERVRELEKDAERYQWLKDNYHGFAHYRSGVIPCVDLDQDIDRQIAFMKRASK